ncbi:hypothetical protein JY456_01030 [Stenotrophomonas maltophilia]|nr:hypothetical protein [Stenotrophomonas maltophilia]
MSSAGKILQLDTAGSFDFYTCAISLDAVHPESFARLRMINDARQPDTARTAEEFHAHDSIMPLIAHEYTHFIDATSTCWGLHHLTLLDNAYRAATSRKEREFHHLKALDNHLRALRLPAYYRTVAKDVKATREWGYVVTIGRRFTANGHLDAAPPIPFCTFHTKDRQHLARAPISVLSLLETSAMAQEIQSRLLALKDLAGAEGQVERRMQSEKALRYLYDHTITEYSVCAHLVANYQGCADIYLAYTLAGMLSRFTLDFPCSGFQLLADSPALNGLFGVHDAHDYIKAVRDGLRVGDRGMLYYVIVCALPPDAAESIDVMGGALRFAIERLGLKMEEVRDGALAEGQALAAQVLVSPSAALRSLGSAGYRNQSKIGQTSLRLDFNVLQLPQAMLADCESHSIFDSDANELGRHSVDFFFDGLQPLERTTAEFAEACI